MLSQRLSQLWNVDVIEIVGMQVMKDEPNNIRKFAPRPPQPTAAECIVSARACMQAADVADADKAARLLREAGEWLKRAQRIEN